MPDNDDRLKQIESTLADTLHPQVAKFAPKRISPVDPTMASLVEDVREHAQALLKLCDQIDLAIKDSDEQARKAGDALIEMVKRIK